MTTKKTTSEGSQPARGGMPGIASGSIPDCPAANGLAGPKQAEAALLAANARLDGIISSAMDAIISIDSEQRVVLFNQAAEKVFGISAKDALGRPIGQFMPERFREAHVQHVRQFGETGTSSRSMGRLNTLLGLRANGEEFPMEASISQIEIQGEKLFTVILRDVTERKAVDDVLHRYSLLAACSRDIILFLRRDDGRILEANAAAQKSYGYHRDELLALTIEDLRAPETRDLAPDQMARADSEGILFETIHRRKDGSTFPVEVSSRGETVGGIRTLISVVRDITRRRKAAEALQQSAQELERSNRDLQQFAYVASHDLQDPLRAVSGYLGLFQRHFPGSLDARALEFIKGAVDGVNRMERLISDLLALSRVGTQGGELAAADLNRSLQDTLQNLQTSIQAAHATVTSDHLPTLAVRETQIVQLFQNLIGNALKFRGEKPPEIHVGVQKEQGRWVFSVRDNGIGIDPQYFQRIFQVFQRLHTRNHYPGTGIGLAICKKIIERHGGAMWVDSQPGHGSTFYFALPDTVEPPLRP